MSQSGSIERSTTRYVPSQQLIANRQVRRLVRRVITGGPLTMAGISAAVASRGEAGRDSEEDEEDDEEEEENLENASEMEGDSRRRTRAEKAAARAQRELLERLQAIPGAVEGLNRVCPSLGALFDSKYGEASVIKGDVAPDVYRRFFFQITAEESVLQMATKPALDMLQTFVNQPTYQNATALVEIPAIHELLTHEKHPTNPFPRRTIEVCRWIVDRGRMVLNSLLKGPEPPKIAEDRAEKPWMETGCCYGLPKIRERPQYPKLKHDINNDVGGKRGAKCSKFYSQYGERRLTGGIMGEGRNDVFSALITRWEKAPKRIIYDFACALGPYCMTLGHTKCSPAAFLKTHCNVDPRLSYINSSAGECGNSGLGRIRFFCVYGIACVYAN
ncbi:hypothetical protein MSAN_01034300 [Mycena sanguinolenta]|uniref:Uncharacterized protein n=1 Tax=Mycena sanguinolenta TaxID=230812 RepID=A0A8H6YMC6_9AGAR|nr:hypothetical protein MSAN_01034300 [Mycena sanguinolenta]